MDIKFALIIWILVAMIASEADGRRGHFRKGARLWCNVFETETVGNGETVGDFCKQIGTEIKEFLKEKKNTVKQTIEKVCQDGDFGDETIKGMMCARLLDDN